MRERKFIFFLVAHLIIVCINAVPRVAYAQRQPNEQLSETEILTYLPEGAKCNFTNCGYWKEGEGYKPAGFVWRDDYHSDDWSQWDVEHVSGTALNIWDKIPGQ